MPIIKSCLWALTNYLRFNGKALLLPAFITAPLYLLAQQFTPDPDWRFENFNGQNHFVSRNINNVTMDKHGYLWACSRGVQRFDGFKTIDYSSLDTSTGGLKNNYTDLISDSSGRIWVSSAGICYYNEVQGKFIYPDPGPHRTITYAYAISIQNQNLWFVCDYGLARLDLRSLKISYTSLPTIANPLCTYALNDSTLLISTREDLYSYNIRRNVFRKKMLLFKNAVVKVFAVKHSHRSVFLATNYGLFSFKSLDEVTPCPGAAGIVINDFLFMPQDKDEEHLFLATNGNGLLIYNTVSQKIELSFLHNNNNPYSISSNLVSRLYSDKTGALWLATAAGVDLLDLTNQQWKIRFLDRNNTDDLTISKIEQDKYDPAKVWMVCYNKGLLRVNWKTKQVETVYDINAETKKILDFAQLSKSRWLLATPKKIIEWDTNNGIISSKNLPVARSISLTYNIRGLISAGDKEVFVTSDRGLFIYDLIAHQLSPVPNAVTQQETNNRLQLDLVNGFYSNNELWAASRDGLFNYNRLTGKVTTYRGAGPAGDYYFFDITAVDDSILACAATTGMVFFNKKTKSFSAINSLANLHEPVCVSILAKNNSIWIGTEAGILNYDRHTQLFSNIGEETNIDQGFPSSSFAIVNNDIVFGIRNGYAYFTSPLAAKPDPSAPVIEAVYVNNQPVLPYYPAQSNRQSFSFDHTENSVRIAFTAFLFSAPLDIKFRYRLKGAGSKWQYTDDQRSANYAQLEPGEYTFYVQSRSKNGVWGGRSATFAFVIRPPYWETWWFRGMVILLTSLGLYGLYRYRINNILAIQRIRERIASDFHDDIGSALSSISIFGDIADTQLEEKAPHEETREVVGHITTHARAMLDAMDDIVWAVNPLNDHFNDLAVRMREFAIPLLEAKNIYFEIDINENILNTRLNMEARKNIFLIFKECVNNLLKHSGCTAMKVSIKKADTWLEMMINDNGKGFDLSDPTNRNGLKNMQKRAAEINGTLSVVTKPGEGVTTRLVIDMT